MSKKLSPHDEPNIQYLEPREHVRMRPGMYVGGVDARALQTYLMETINHVVDEVLAGRITELELTLRRDNFVHIRDNGPGTILEFPSNDAPPTFANMLEHSIHRIGRADRERYKYLASGVATLTPSNALSAALNIEVAAQGAVWRQSYREGAPQGPVERVRDLAADEATGMTLMLTPDHTIFERNDIDFAWLADRAEELAWLLPELTVTVHDERVEPRVTRTFDMRSDPGGYLAHLNRDHTTLHPPLVGSQIFRVPGFRDQWLEARVEVALQYIESDDTIEHSYLNTNRHAGGLHWLGLRSALADAINRSYLSFSDDLHDAPPFSAAEVAPGLTAIISLYHPHPTMESARRQDLIDPAVYGMVAGVVFETATRYDLKDDIRDPILAKCVANREQRR